MCLRLSLSCVCSFSDLFLLLVTIHSFFSSTLPFLVRLLLLLLNFHFLLFYFFYIILLYFAFVSRFIFHFIFISSVSLLMRPIALPPSPPTKKTLQTVTKMLFFLLSFCYSVETSEQCIEALPRDVSFFYIACMCSRYIHSYMIFSICRCETVKEQATKAKSTSTSTVLNKLHSTNQR